MSGRSARSAPAAESRGRQRPGHPRRKGRGGGDGPVGRRSRTAARVTRPRCRAPATRGGNGAAAASLAAPRTTRPGLSPESDPPQASPPCARSATSNSLHCPAPPRSRPSSSLQPFTPPSPQGRAQEGPSVRGSNSVGRCGCPTASPGGWESRHRRLRPEGARLRPAPPRGRGLDAALRGPRTCLPGPKASADCPRAVPGRERGLCSHTRGLSPSGRRGRQSSATPPSPSPGPGQNASKSQSPLGHTASYPGEATPGPIYCLVFTQETSRMARISASNGRPLVS